MAEVKQQENSKKQKFIIISGITSGIGEGLLYALNKRGHKVAGFGRNEKKILELRQKFPEKNNDKVNNNKKDNKKENNNNKQDKKESKQSKKDESKNNNDNNNNAQLIDVLDITNEENVTKWCENIISKYGIPDMIINNAVSNAGGNKNSWQLDISELHKSLNTNIIGSILLIKGFVPSMCTKNSGIIINISSWAGNIGVAELSPYVMSKHAIEGLTKCMSKEFEEFYTNMACISVSPGWVNTPLFQSSFEGQQASKLGIENGIQWAEKCSDWLLSLNSSHNGQSLAPPLEHIAMKKYVDFFAQYGIYANINDYIHKPGIEDEDIDKDKNKQGQNNNQQNQQDQQQQEQKDQDLELENQQQK